MPDRWAGVAVEFGHRHFRRDEPAALEEADYVGVSALLADDLRTALVRQGNDVTMQVLVDDKYLSDADDRRAAVAGLLDEVAGFADPESVVLESRLRSLSDGLIVGLQPDKQPSRRRKFASYLERHGRLACSQDIAIWHALRLGAIEVGHDGEAAHEVRVRSSPVVVSILSERHRQFEEVADRDYLRWHSVISPRADVLRFYVPDGSPVSRTATTSPWRGFRDLVLRRAQSFRLVESVESPTTERGPVQEPPTRPTATSMPS